MEMEIPSEASAGETSDKVSNVCQTHLFEYLSSAYEVLRKVFSYLYLDDIENAAEAIESWRSVAEVTKRERKCIESFVISDQKYKMSKIWGEAKLCISFCTMPSKKIDQKVTKFIIPGGESVNCLSGAGVIGTVHDLSRIVQQKVRVGLSTTHKKFYHTTMRIPQIPKVGVKTFIWEENVNFEDFKKKIDIPSNQIVKCLIILMIAEESDRRANMQKDDFINFLQDRQNQAFAIGGTVVDNFINYSRSNSGYSVTQYIVFYGDNVDAASTILTDDIKSLAGINNKIKKLKEMCPKTKKGALFVFRCTGRQRVIRRSKLGMTNIIKWEGETIQKYFPSTPVIGCFGYGEFGTEYPYDHEDCLSIKHFKAPCNWEFRFSTSIVYVGFMK